MNDNPVFVDLGGGLVRDVSSLIGWKFPTSSEDDATADEISRTHWAGAIYGLIFLADGTRLACHTTRKTFLKRLYMAQHGPDQPPIRLARGEDERLALIDETMEQARQIRAQADQIAQLKQTLEDTIGELGTGIADRNGQIAQLKSEIGQARAALGRVVDYAQRLITWPEDSPSVGSDAALRRSVGQAIVNLINSTGPEVAAYVNQAQRIAELESLLETDSGLITAFYDYGLQLKNSPDQMNRDRQRIGGEMLRMIEDSGRQPARAKGDPV